jgi:S1-C subfamily serine protease
VTAETPRPLRKSKQQGATPLFLLIGGGGALAACVIGVIVWAMSSGNGSPAAKDGDKKVPKDATHGILVLDWPEDERSHASLSIDGKSKTIPPAGVIELKLKPGKHLVGILRKDFEPFRKEVVLGKGATENIRPQWQEATSTTSAGGVAGNPPSSFPLGSAIVIPGFEGWLQNLAVAKEKAAAEKKDILIVFGSSDGNLNTRQLAATLKTAGLPGGELAKKYVPLVIDFPETGNGGNRVLDLRQNRKLKGEYGIDDRHLPVLALADSKGHPFAVEREWSAAKKEITQAIETMSGRRQERDSLLAATSQGNSQQQLAAAVGFINWASAQKLVLQYRDAIHPWWNLAVKEDPTNATGKQEVVLEAEMMCQLTDLPEGVGRVEIAERLDLLQPWLQDRRFSDGDRGFKLHFIAGNILGQIGEEATALAHLNRAVTYEPKDPELQEAKKLAIGQDRNILSSGTGFVVAEGGYILTNKHVVDGPGRVAVRIAGVKDPVPAKSVKLHTQLDVALVQVDLPESYKPQPVGLSTSKLNRGLEVGAFGYPQGDALGSDLKFTKGAISSLPNASLDNMILLDLRINPGNSGGPLCDIQGNVVGMITAKTSGVNLDSYGMAIPVEELEKFLTAVVPADAKRGKPQSANPNSTWAQVDANISPSVLMVVKIR